MVKFALATKSNGVEIPIPAGAEVTTAELAV